MPPHELLILAVVCLSILLMLLRPRGIPEVWWVSGGAVLLLLTRLLQPRAALQAVLQGTDVYLFLAGMMLLSEVAQTHGLFDWVAHHATQSARGSSLRLFTLIYLAGTLITICLSNDATAVVLTPAVLAVARRADVNPKPHVFACALIANAASFVLPFSNPANLVVFHAHMPSLLKWLTRYTLASVLSIVTTWLVLRTLFRQTLRQPATTPRQSVPLTLPGRISLLGIVLITALLLLGAAFSRPLGQITLAGAVLLWLITAITAHASPWPQLQRISWSTLLLVAALFVLVAGIERTTVIHSLAAAVHHAESLGPTVATLLVGSVIAVANNLVNNLPLGLLVSNALQQAHTSTLLTSAAMIAIDLGPNLSVTGSLATILWLLALRRENIHITPWQFLKIGLITMPLALLTALLGLLASQRWFT